MAWPPFDGSNAVLFGVEQGVDVSVDAINLANPPLTPLRVNAEHGAATVQALAYDETLSDLQIPAGRLQPATGDTRALPTPKRVYSMTVAADGTVGPWQTVAAASGNVARFELPAIVNSACTPWALDSRPIPNADSDGVFMVPIDDRSVLAGTSKGILVRVDAERLQVVTATPALPRPIRAAYRDPDGDLYFASGRADFWFGRVRDTTLTYSRLPSLPSFDDIRWLDGGLAPGGWRSSA